MLTHIFTFEKKNEKKKLHLEVAGSNPGGGKKKIKTQILLFFLIIIFFKQVYYFFPNLSSYGHTTVKAPHPIRTAKLSTVGLDQYFGRGLQGNLQCCMAFFLLFDRWNYVFVGANAVLVLAPGVLAQSEACVLSKHEVLGSKPRYSSPIWCSW